MFDKTIYHIALTVRKFGIPVGQTRYEKNTAAQRAFTEYLQLMEEMNAKQKTLITLRRQCDIKLQELLQNRLLTAASLYDIAMPSDTVTKKEVLTDEQRLGWD